MTASTRRTERVYAAAYRPLPRIEIYSNLLLMSRQKYAREPQVRSSGKVMLQLVAEIDRLGKNKSRQKKAASSEGALAIFDPDCLKAAIDHCTECEAEIEASLRGIPEIAFIRVLAMPNFTRASSFLQRLLHVGMLVGGVLENSA
jgi:hypothetical protein